TDDYYFFGSWGRGLAKHDKISDEITVYNSSNSPLNGFLESSSFVIIPGLATDSEGDMWVVSWSHDRGDALYKFNPDTNEWINYPRSRSALSADTYFDLTIDSFDQKWVSLMSTSVTGRGLLVLRTDENQNEQSVRLSEDNGNLPHNSVNAMVQDERGEMWVATSRGVVRFPFPDRVIEGNFQDRQGNLLINADTTAGSAYLLSTIHATAIAVNAANEKWIGTEGDGLWLIAEDGGRHSVKHHFTTDNSPLISDNITSLVVDDETGKIFIATDEGLITYTDVIRGGKPEMDDLFIYPNPFSYQNEAEERIIIDGLSERSIVRIVSVDGRLVNRLEARGGRVEWNARDYNNNRIATGVYLVIAVDENNGSRGSGKVVIVR
ncbi:MAG: two-component regulator propeller domain-containing protein, partial [Balneolales bacterium]